MVDKERLNALEVALDNEMREREFYLKKAEKTKNPLGKLMFQQIAEEELEHYERLKQLHEQWKKGAKWPDTVPLEVNGTRVKNMLIRVTKMAEEVSEQNANDLKAIRTAIAFEAKGAKYYAELSEKVSDPKEKAFFKLLAQIENEHYLTLKDTEEYLTDPGSWYRKIEHHGLDGA
ncbi:MAG: ferritin family protein [Deltaproteobacteria bacterium]|nr:ferritin family protein [Deltaproteobacteria bacterium]